MNHIITATALLFITSLIACGNSTSSSKIQETNSENKELTTTPTPSTNIYKRYEGTIANQQVVVYWQQEDSLIWGSYYYTKIGKPIELNGRASTDSLRLDEYNQQSFEARNIESPIWRIIQRGDSLIGKWWNPNNKKSFEILLKEKQAMGSHSLAHRKFIDSVTAFPGNPKSPQAQSEYSLVWMEATSEKAGIFNQQILNSLYIGGTDLAAGIRLKNDSFFATYKEHMKQEDATNEEDKFGATWNYFQSTHDIIKYNSKDIVAVEHSYYSYMGGAHGNYYSNFSNIDLQQGKALQVTDVLKADSSTLQKLLETAFRKDYQLVGKSLEEVLFDPYLATTDNFYITEKGLQFVYNPYEVAAYAVGQLYVFLPYAVLGNYLQDNFKKRMQL